MSYTQAVKKSAWIVAVGGVAVLSIAALSFPQAPPSTTVLTGTVLRLDSSESGGHPWITEWFVTPPDAPTPGEPTSTSDWFDQTFNLPGTWIVDLNLVYHHEVDGHLWTSQAQLLVEAKSVVAVLDPGPLEITTTQTLSMNGFDSVVSDLAVASAVFRVDGEPLCTFPGPITNPGVLECEAPASDFGAGPHQVSLEMNDSVSGTSDSDEATIEIVEEPPFAVDFSWSQSGSDPMTVLVVLQLSAGWSFADLETAVWNFGDGSGDEPVTCGPGNYYCQFWSHGYANEGYYDASVEVTTDTGLTASVIQEVTAGDPPALPTVDFLVSPVSPLVNEPTSFTFTGSCEGDCVYTWDFDDGTTSGLSNPTHVFAESRIHMVQLTVENGAGAVDALQAVPVINCWNPVIGITQAGSCYGAAIALTAPLADGYAWNTGAVTRTVTVAEPTTYWVHLRQGAACWAYTSHAVQLESCQGTPEGNVDMDPQERVDAMDAQALIRELGDDDGALLIDSWAAEIGAPGADLTGEGNPEPDGLITHHDLDRLLEIIFSE